MKGLIALVVVLAVVGGGYYFYSENQAPAQEDAMTADFGMTAEDEMDAMDIDNSADTSQTPSTQPSGTVPASSGAGTGVDVGASLSTGTVKEFTVTGKNFSFAPASMTVKKGDTVKITFVNSSGTHDLVVDGYNARTKIIQGGAQETITFVADKAGSFEYYCSVGSHRQMGMKGTLVVQ